MNIETVKLADIHHDPANSRAHDDRNLSAITASLKEFGQVEPLVVQKGTGKVIGGNGRLTAMLAMGMTEAAVVEVEADGVRAAALGIALNRTAELATWDDAALAQTLAALQNDDSIDELCTGFSGEEIEKLIGDAAGVTAPEDFKEVDENIETDHQCPKCGYRYSGGQ